MSDFIPFDIQREIIKRAPDVTSVIRFRSVSKPWKSFIDSPEFIAGFGARNTDPHRLIIRYYEKIIKHHEVQKLICLVDDDNIYDALTRKQLPLFAPPSIDLYKSSVVGNSNGLLFLYRHTYGKKMVVIWNPSIRRSVGIPLPYVPDKYSFYCFGVCPITNDPTIVRISYASDDVVDDDEDDETYMANQPWQVEVFTLSSGVWKTVSENLPCQTIRLIKHGDVVIGKFIYCLAMDLKDTRTAFYRGELTLLPKKKDTRTYMIMSFDMVAKTFRVVDIPVSLTNSLIFGFGISKLRDSLVVYGSHREDGEVGKAVCGVWKMEYDGSFTKLYNIYTDDSTLCRVLAFRMSGEPVIETQKRGEPFSGLEVYEPCSKHISNLGIHGERRSFFVGSYMESLLLLDYSDGYVFPEN